MDGFLLRELTDHLSMGERHILQSERNKNDVGETPQGIGIIRAAEMRALADEMK